MIFKYILFATLLAIALITLGSMLLITGAAMRDDENKQQCENVAHGKFLIIRSKSICLKSDAIIWIK